MKVKYLLPIIVALMLGACGPLPVHSGYEYCHVQGRLKECITVPLAGAKEDAEAKQFTAPGNGKARIYLVRPYAGQSKIKSKVFLDERFVAEMGPRTYLVIDTEPGKHLIKVRTGEEATISVGVAPGQIYYVQYRQDPWFFSLVENLVLLDATKAQPRVRKARRVALLN